MKIVVALDPFEQLMSAICNGLEFLLVSTPLGDIPAIAGILECLLNLFW